MSKSSASMAGPPPGSNRLNVTSLLAGFALGAVLASLAWVQIVPRDSGEAAFDPNDFFVVGSDGAAPVDGGPTGPQTRVIQEGGGTTEAADSGGGVSLSGDAAAGGAAGGSEAEEGSGSATGVSANKIKLGATYVSDGLACAFLCEVRDAMEAVRSRVNGKGGIHGRQLDIVYKADGWNPTTGARFLENLIVQEKVFAFAVSPSSEGLNAAARAGLFEKHGVPVVGADGLNNSQFIDVASGKANPWIWPVATATTTNVHIILEDAWQRAKAAGQELKPAIVFGNTYRFGVEGAYAFNQAYKERSGKDIPGYSDGETGCKPNSRYCGIRGDWNGGGEASAFEQACKSGDGCNFVLILLEPGTALNWMAKFGIRPGDLDFGMAGAQPLFTTKFGDQCKEKCADMVIWTGYNPPIGGFQQKPEVAAYTQALTAQKASADVNNQFSLGGYIGMELLVKALEEAGKDLDRGKLVQVLNSLSLASGLTAAPSLKWSEGQKYANNAAHGFSMKWNTTQGTFTGFERTRDYVKDPWLGQHNQPPT